MPPPRVCVCVCGGGGWWQVCPLIAKMFDDPPPHSWSSIWWRVVVVLTRPNSVHAQTRDNKTTADTVVRRDRGDVLTWQHERGVGSMHVRVSSLQGSWSVLWENQLLNCAIPDKSRMVEAVSSLVEASPAKASNLDAFSYCVAQNDLQKRFKSQKTLFDSVV
jgi:hypothetical protein